MASFTKRGESWYARVYVPGKGRLCKSFRLKATAVAWAAEVSSSFEKTGSLPNRHTLAEALEKYAEVEVDKKAGARWERVRLKKFLRTVPFVNKDLQSITPADIALWRDSQTIAPGSVRREMVQLQSVFDVAVREWGWLTVNPMIGVRKPASPRARQAVYTDEQIVLICSHLNGPLEQEVALAFRLSIETAMRSSELLSLSWDQVDLQRRVVHLEKTKNGDDRFVPLSQAAVDLFTSCSPQIGKVFRVSAGSRDALFRKARGRAGLQGLTFHDARATALTRLSRKVDVLTLARIAGHRDLKSLMVYYRESAEDIAKRL